MREGKVKVVSDKQLEGRVYEDLESSYLLDRQHTKQREATRAPERIRVLFWGNRTGKTSWGAQEVVRYMFGLHEYKDVKAPCEVWVGCPSYDLQKETVQEKLLKLIPSYRIIDKTYVKKGVFGELLFDNGSRIVFKSYEQGREKFQGVGKRLIWLDEEPPKDIWEECSVRVEAGQDMDIIMTMTPINGMSWVYHEIYLATDNPDIFISTGGWDDNPWLTSKQKLEMGRGLTEEALQVRKFGKFVQRTGLVCTWWNRNVHLKANLTPKPDWRIYRIIDFGWSSSKTCALWIGVDSFDRIYIFDGIYVNELSDIDLAKMIKDKESSFKVTRSWADNVPDRIETLRRYGVYSDPVKKSTSDSSWDTERSEAMARLGRINPTTDKSLLHVDKALMYYDAKLKKDINFFVEEVESLKWSEKKTHSGSKSVSRWNKDDSLTSSHYDAIDAFSYFCIMYNKSSSPHKHNPSPAFKQKKSILAKLRDVINPITGF